MFAAMVAAAGMAPRKPGVVGCIQEATDVWVHPSRATALRWIAS